MQLDLNPREASVLPLPTNWNSSSSKSEIKIKAMVTPAAAAKLEFVYNKQASDAGLLIILVGH